MGVTLEKCRDETIAVLEAGYGDRKFEKLEEIHLDPCENVSTMWRSAVTPREREEQRP